MNVNLTNAHLDNVNLTGVDFKNTDLTGTSLANITLTKVKLHNVTLYGASYNEEKRRPRYHSWRNCSWLVLGKETDKNIADSFIPFEEKTIERLSKSITKIQEVVSSFKTRQDYKEKNLRFKLEKLEKLKETLQKELDKKTLPETKEQIEQQVTKWIEHGTIKTGKWTKEMAEATKKQLEEKQPKEFLEKFPFYQRLCKLLDNNNKEN